MADIPKLFVLPERHRDFLVRNLLVKNGEFPKENRFVLYLADWLYHLHCLIDSQIDTAAKAVLNHTQDINEAYERGESYWPISLADYRWLKLGEKNQWLDLDTGNFTELPKLPITVITTNLLLLAHCYDDKNEQQKQTEAKP